MGVFTQELPLWICIVNFMCDYGTVAKFSAKAVLYGLDGAVYSLGQVQQCLGAFVMFYSSNDLH